MNKIAILAIIALLLMSCSVQSAKLNFSGEKDVALLDLEGMKKEPSFLFAAKKANAKEIHFNLSVDEIELFKQPAGEYLKVSDLMPYTKPGEPMLPMKTFVVSFPKNSKISDVYVTFGKYRKINNKMNIIPTPQPHTFSAKMNFILNKNRNYSLINSYFPGKIISYDTGFDNENTYVLVRFFPVQYIPEQNEALLITDVNIRIEYDENDEKPQVKNLLPEINSGCVIITPEELKAQADELAKFHNSTNVSTEVITTQQIWDNCNASQDPAYDGYKNSSIGGWNNIKNYNYTLAKKIMSFLNEQSNSNLEYVVLFGNARLVPPSYYFYNEELKYCDCFTCWGIDYYNSWVPTDFFYVSPDYDLIPNYKVGRIPVNNTFDAEHFVNKTKNWYNNLHNNSNNSNNSNGSWFKNVAVMGGRLLMNIECGRYDEIFTGELTAVDVINRYSDGMNITKIFLSEDNYNEINVKNAYIGNYGFIYQNSHGSGNGMWKNTLNGSEKLINVSDINVLPENSRVPVVVSPACMNGAYDTDLRPNDYYGYLQQESFSESLLNSDAGGIAYFGGTRTTYENIGVYLKEGRVQTVKQGYMAGMLDGIFKSYHEGARSLGKLSLDAITQFVINNEFSDELTTKTLFEYTFLGDPALTIPPREEAITYERPKLNAVNPLHYEYDNVGHGWNPSVGDLPIYSLYSNATVTCKTESENVKIKLIDTSKIFNNTNITGFDLSNNSNNYVNYTFNLTEPHTYLVRCTDENGKEGWLYAKTDVVKAEIAGNYTDYAQDIDNDSKYEYLTINVTINVTQAGLYIIEAYLLAYETEDIWGYTSEVVWIFLDKGINVVSINFDGYEIHRIGIDGIYYLGYIRLYDNDAILIDGREGWVYEIENNYPYISFEDINNTFTPPYSDYGADVNNNSLYDYLVINLTVNVSYEGSCTIEGILQGVLWNEDYTDYDYTEEYIYKQEPVYLYNGTQSIQLKFSGYEIFKWEIDGPYLLEDLCIYDSRGVEVECIFINQGYTTKDYNHTEFENNPPLFTGLFSNFSDYISDSYYENNGIMYKNLIINITFNVSDAGNYIIAGELYDENETLIAQSGNIYNLSNGAQTIQLNFSGSRIYENAANGNYHIKELYLKDVNNTILDYRETTYTTLEYNHSQFRMPPDLAVANIEYENTIISALIENLMTVNDKNLEEVNVSLYIDNQLNQTTILNLRNKKDYTANFSWAAVEKKYSITIKVDAGDKIPELNEGNNNLTKILSVFRCDLNNDGVTIQDYNALMTAYRCLLGISSCNTTNYQDWDGMVQEYRCFVGNKTA